MALMGLLVLGCGGTKTKEVEVKVPTYRVLVTEDTNVDDCGCSPNSQWVVTNNHPSNDKIAIVRRIVTDVSTGAVITNVLENIPLPSEASEILSCAIVDPNETPSCRRAVEYRLVDETPVVSMVPGPKATGLQSLFTTEFPTCEAVCANPASPYCYRVGPRSASLLFPILELYEAAQQNQSDVIRKQEYFDKYGVDPERDKCQRGDVSVSENRVENVSATPGGKECLASNDNVSIELRLPKKVSALVVDEALLSSSRAKKAIRFDENYSAPNISFTSGQISVAMADDFDRLFGGYVRTVGETDRDIIIATTNGCLRVEKR